jgi:uncharacterized protein YebE (UPF0316 family)
MTTGLLLSALGIFGLRILDVSVGTLRIGMLVRGKRRLAGIFSFFESLIWLTAAAQVLTSLDSPIKFVAYAAGYATGTVLGSTLERWLAVGNAIIRFVATPDSPDVASSLREVGYYVTVVNGSGRDGDVMIGFSVVPRKQVKEVVSLIQRINPKAHITLEETTTVRRVGIPPAAALRK